MDHLREDICKPEDSEGLKTDPEHRKDFSAPPQEISIHATERARGANCESVILFEGNDYPEKHQFIR